MNHSFQFSEFRGEVGQMAMPGWDPRYAARTYRDVQALLAGAAANHVFNLFRPGRAGELDAGTTPPLQAGNSLSDTQAIGIVSARIDIVQSDASAADLAATIEAISRGTLRLVVDGADKVILTGSELVNVIGDGSATAEPVAQMGYSFPMPIIIPPKAMLNTASLVLQADTITSSVPFSVELGAFVAF